MIVGDGPMRRRLARTIARTDLAGSVRLLRGVEMSAMPEVYAAADVFALPCRTRLAGLEPEALGIVFLEAAAAGLPVVVGDSGGAPETVVTGQTGFVVDPRSPHDVAQRICDLLDDPAAAREMGRLGRERVLRLFTPEAAVATLQRLLAGGQE
jgi:phosphatidylinositol alpha-1,6-mannosyltransferase